MNYTAGAGVGNPTCVQYPTTDDSRTDSAKVFILDIVSMNTGQLIPDCAKNSTVVRIVDNDSKSSSVGTRTGRPLWWGECILA